MLSNTFLYSTVPIKAKRKLEALSESGLNLARRIFFLRTDPEKNPQVGDTWVTQLVEWPTVDFSSRHDLRVLRSSSMLGSLLGMGGIAGRVSLFEDSLSSPPPAPPPALSNE